MTNVIDSAVKAGTSKEPIIRAAAGKNITTCQWVNKDARTEWLHYLLEWELWCPAGKYGRASSTENCSLAFRLTLDPNHHPSDYQMAPDIPRMVSGEVEASAEDVNTIFRDLADAGRFVEKIIDDHRYRPFGYNEQVELSEPNASRLLFKSCLNGMPEMQAAE